jgi:Zn-dependent protease
MLGIPVSADASWLIIVALLTMTLAGTFPDFMQEYFPGITQQAPAMYWFMGLVATLVFFGCIMLHELRHAVVTRPQRIPVRVSHYSSSADLRRSQTSRRQREPIA